MSNIAAIVKSLVGQVFAVSIDGLKRQIFEGERLLMGEQILTGLGGEVTLQLASGELVNVAQSSNWQAPAGEEPAEQAAAEPASELEQAIAAGFDPTTDLEATAAGPGAGGNAGGGAGGGHSFVMLDIVGGQLDPTIGFPTEGLNSAVESLNDVAGEDRSLAVTGASEGVPTVTIPNDGAGVDASDLNVAENGTTTGSFTISAPDGLTSLGLGNTVISAADLANSANSNVTVPGTNGTLTITGFDAATGVVSYSYDPTGTSTDHSTGAVVDSFAVVVTDPQGDTQAGTPSLDILIIDTAPVANADTRTVSEDDTGIEGNLVTGTNATADTLGADAATVTGLQAGNAGSAEVTGNLGGTGVAGIYGTLIVNASGGYSYVTNAAAQALVAGASVTDTFSYTLKDSDGSFSTTTVTFTVTGASEGVPTVTIPNDGAGVDASDLNVAENGTTTGSFTISAPDGLTSLGLGNTVISAADLANSANSNVTVPGTNGTLTITGFDAATGVVSYSYDPTGTSTDHSTGAVVDSFAVVVTDPQGDTQAGTPSLDILIIDTAPVANADIDSVGIGGTTTGNVILGTGGIATTGADTLSADAPNIVKFVRYDGIDYEVTQTGTEIVTDNGTLNIQQNGSYTYTSSHQSVAVVANGNTATIVANWTAAGVGVYGFDTNSIGGGQTQTNQLYGNPLNIDSINVASLNGTATARMTSRDVSDNDDDGIGVESGGSSSGNARIQNGENLVLDLGFESNSAKVTLTALGNSEAAIWRAYDANGDLVGNGTVGGNNNDIVTATITTTQDYQYLVFTSGGATYLVNGLIAEANLSGVTPDVFEYTLEDADESQSSATLTISTDATPAAGADITTVYEAGLTAGGSQTAGTQAGVAPTVASGNLFDNDLGIGANTTITSINGTTPVSGVITISNTIGTLVVNANTGAYTYTLNRATTEGVNDTPTFNYVVRDSVSGQSSNANLVINIVDDTPTGSDITQTLQAADGSATYNLVIVLDRSGSMAQDADGNWSSNANFDPATVRMEIAKQALAQLLDRFDGLGNVNVKIVDFADSAASSDWFIDDKTNAIHYINTVQAGGGTQYDDALSEVMNSWGTPPAADKTLFYFITDGSPSSGGAISNNSVPSISQWQDFVAANGDISFAIGIGSAGLNNITPIAYPNDSNGVSEPYAVKLENPTDLLSTLLETVDGGVVLGSLSMLTGNGSTNGILLGADGGSLSSITVDGTVYTNASGNTQVILTNKGGELTVNFTTGEYMYRLQLEKTIQGEEEVFHVVATDGDGDTRSIDLKIELDYWANLDANRDTILTNTQAGQSITLSETALLHNDAAGNGASITGTQGATNGTVNGSNSITFTPNISGAPAQAIRVATEAPYDDTSQLQNNNQQNAIDFTDRSKFGTTGQSGSGWSVDTGINGFTQVLRGQLQSGGNGHDWVKVYLYAGERIRIDVDGVSGSNSNPSSNVTRTVLDANGNTLLTGTTSDTWFTATDTGEYFIRLQASNTVDYNLVLTVDANSVKGAIGPSAGSFDYTMLENNATDSAKVEIFHVAGNTINGTDADEILIGGGTNDILHGGGGHDVLLGGAGDDQLFGGAGSDRLEGGTGVDTLYGGTGNDILIGGEGDDILFGGAGTDTFVWQAGDLGADQIKDFSRTDDDVIDLSDLFKDINLEVVDLSDYLRLDTDSSRLLISTSGELGDGGAADITIKVENAGGNVFTGSDTISSLIAGGDLTLVKANQD
ncbi:retention module-containing protein [Pseudomonas sp. WS 5011]|uniref:retention module-containing protein n=1 Tax=Pseudomonas sp. WS 5011 TaxID=2717477 RepID=UPI0014758970|nr:retention module-containing protein [Pseudomonas sp. WS 5011]NMY49591.1 retention module-containing protein [Pseudomonas sp. WS 5011]